MSGPATTPASPQRADEKRIYVVPVRCYTVRDVVVSAPSAREALRRVRQDDAGECPAGVQFGDETYGRVRLARKGDR